jgi:hypothetical protein
LIVFNLKTFCGVFYLKWFRPDEINKSSSTGELFWFRVEYDLLFFFCIMFFSRYYGEVDDKGWFPNDEVSVRFNFYCVMLPLLFSWIIIYEFSVKPSYDRVAYQTYGKYKKRDSFKYKFVGT